MISPKVLLLCVLVITHRFANAQSVAINNESAVADASSMLDIKSNSKGLLLPRMTKAQKNGIITPAEGLLVYQTGPDSIGFHYYSASQWLWLDPFVSNTWKIGGNSGTDTSVNFIGTNDAMPLRFRQNNFSLGLWDLNRSNYFIGKSAGLLKPSQMMGSIAIGDSAMAAPGNSNTPGANSFNIAIGLKALRNHRAQIGNVAIGAFSMQDFIAEPSGGYGSVAVGYASMPSIKSGDRNVAIGSYVLMSDTIGNNNTAVGMQALAVKMRGDNNLAVGMLAGGSLRVSNQNTFLGALSNSTIDSLVNASAIGARAIVDTSNSMVLGSIAGINGATNNTNVGIGTTKPKAALHVSRGQSGNNLSIPSSRSAIIEDNASSYLQFLTPNANESGILAGSASTLIKSGMVFQPDSSMSFRTGGNVTRVIVDKTGNVGINKTPASRLDVRGSVGMPIRFIAADYVVTENDHSIIKIPSVASISLTLPVPDDITGRQYVLVNYSNLPMPTDRGYFDFTGNLVSNIPSHSSVTIQASGDSWYRIR